MYSDITGIILSGGKSSRMGENKSLMKIGNKTVIEVTSGLMKALFKEVILITNEPEEYSFLNVPMFKDIYPGKGPLSGIHSGLFHSATVKNFIISCDLPLMKSEMIEYLVDYPSVKPAVIAKADGYLQQLCGMYSKECYETAEKILIDSLSSEGRDAEQKKRGCKVIELINTAGADIIDAEKLPFYNRDMYFNMNRKEEFDYVKRKVMMNDEWKRA